ncbi:MAG: hypothetical protein ABUS54_02605 [Actinomycetota bacterium]
MNDVIARLAAANPVPVPARRRRLRTRWLVAAAAAVCLVPAAVAVADEIGVSNGGTTVPTSAAPLDEVLHDLNVGDTMQYLGTLNGVGFYAGRDGAGRFCLAIEHVGRQYEKGAGCDWRPDGFPSTAVRAFAFPPARQLEGVAADGVATVQALDADGNVLDSTPVVHNLFASSVPLDGAATAIRTLDAGGNVLTTQRLHG